MSKRFKILNLISLISLIVLSIVGLRIVTGCGGQFKVEGEGGGGGGGTTPTISSIEDADGNVLTNGARDINPTTLTVIFSSDVTDAICSNSDISLSCTYGPIRILTPNLEFAKSETDSTACIVTVEDPWKYGLMDCTLSYNADIVASEVLLLDTSASSLSFTTACSVGDDFNSVTSDCWSIADDSGVYPLAEPYNGDVLVTPWLDWNDFLENILSFSPSNSTLNYDAFSESRAAIYKEGILDSDFEFVLQLKDIANFDANEDGLSGGLTDIATARPPGNSIFFGIHLFEEGFLCSIIYAEAGELAGFKASDCSNYSDISIRIRASDDTWTFQYKGDDNDWADINEIEMLEIPPPSEYLRILVSNPNLMLMFDSKNPTNASAKVESIQATGFTVVDQY